MRITRSLFAIIATVLIAAAPLAASAQVSFGIAAGVGGPGWGVGVVGYAPPALPVYSMPPAPYANAQWCPGYWGYGSYGYYWVPGYWAAPPAVGLYWTPGYWGYANGGYAWNAGYWGPSVGFYGGVNYGYGYFGVGFVGGYWSGGAFSYNTAVVNVNRTVIRNTYFNRTVVHGRVVSRSRASFNGGPHGIRATPTRAQLAARHAVGMTAAQRAHQRVAARDRGMLAAVNHGHPRVAAVQRPLSATHRPAAMHGSVSAAVHHSAAATHGSMSAATHHSAAATHGTVSAHAYSHPTYRIQSGAGYSHAAYGARPAAGGYSHGSFGGGRVSGGRPPGGGGGGGRGRPPHG